MVVSRPTLLSSVQTKTSVNTGIVDRTLDLETPISYERLTSLTIGKSNNDRKTDKINLKVNLRNEFLGRVDKRGMRHS